MPDLWLDAHAHLWEFSLLNYFPSLETAHTLEECINLMSQSALEEWRVGIFLKRDNYIEKTQLNSISLDRAFGKHPAVIIWEYLHKVTMNKEAMRRLGMGSKNGVFYQNDVYHIPKQIFRFENLEARPIILKGWQKLVDLGYGRIIDMTMDKDKRRLFGKIDFYTSDWDLMDEALGYKIFLDGSLGMRTAALRDAYKDDPGNNGRLKYSDGKLLKLVEKVHALDKPVACHVIGDRALAQFLRIMQKSRHPLDRVEHLNVASTRQLDDLAEYQIPVCISPSFSADLPWAEQRLGEKRLSTAYAWNLMRHTGIRLLAGTDAPAYPASPEVILNWPAQQSGSHHLDSRYASRIFARDNWQFYNWPAEISSPI